MKKLLTVKSIVTLALTLVFSILACLQIIPAGDVVSIYTMIIAFYFGTQHEKGGGENGESK